MDRSRPMFWISVWAAGSLAGHGWALWIGLSWMFNAGVPASQVIQTFVLPATPFFAVVSALGVAALRGAALVVPWGAFAFPFLLGEGIPALGALSQSHVQGEIVWANGLGGGSDLALVAWLSRLLAVWWVERSRHQPR